MNERADGEVYINAEIDIVSVRKAVREVAGGVGFGVTDVTRIVTAASELARNIYTYANRGVMRWCALSANGRAGIELIFEDKGPGIPDIEQAMAVGYTSGDGLGMGLPGSKRLMGELHIQSEAGVGTTVTVRKWLGRI